MRKASVTKLATPVTMPSNLPEDRVIPILDWIAIPCFFSQRNHEARIRATKHVRRFKEVKPTHLRVAAVRFPDGKLFKVDGHTRTQAWINGLCEMPSAVRCDIYDVQTRDQAREIYECIDGREATKHSHDSVFSALREFGAMPTSPLLAECRFGSALNIVTRRACGAFTKCEQVRLLAPAINAFDTICPQKEWFSIPVIAAALLSIQRDGEQAVLFWSAVNVGSPSPSWIGNAHMEMRDFITTQLKTRHVSSGGVNGREAMTGRCLAIYNEWAANANRRIDGCAVASAIDGVLYLQNFKEQIAK